MSTKLDAVNEMLASIGQAPVNALTGNGISDVGRAVSHLDRENIKVQNIGWEMNTVESHTLSPHATTKEITLPSNCLRVKVILAGRQTYESRPRYQKRGNRLFDMKNRTYEFDGDVAVDYIELLDFEVLPESLQHYITIKAGRKFAQSVMPSQKIRAWSKDDEIEAYIAAQNEEEESVQANILADNADGINFLARTLGSYRLTDDFTVPESS